MARQLYSSVLIIGFVGPLGSGCSFIAHGLQDQLGDRAHYYKLSKYLREIAKCQGISDPTTEQLQDIGNELRHKKGLSVLAEMCIDQIRGEVRKAPTTWADDHVVIIDSIRNEGEVRYLRSFPNFYLFSVFAHYEERRRRIVGPDRDLKKEEDFQRADERDQREDHAYGQQVASCNYLSDATIDNNETFPTRSKKQKRRLLCIRIEDDYVSLTIAAAFPHVEIQDRRPTTQETLMTAAYAVSKKSNCLNRHVGAVIAFVPKEKPAHARDATAAPPFRIISSGYNEVPVGNTPCAYSGEGKCYRDFLQEQHARRWKNCPNCGQPITQKMKCSECGETVETISRKCTTRECQKIPMFDYTCPGCKIKVFTHFLTGGKKTPTRMLDMCKALHAEENALLGMPSFYQPAAEGQLVLFTTTFPCNLCANKIVGAGIRKVVFAEPYPMQEARQVLSEGGVEIVQFEGIKSRAYFKLFA
ncbi:MAG: hypothetical protein A2498_15065 [Lentisphaerae bacterium RIFOXYC12_FULL_60_16]|nr:MAG: hypothetical protein A2498_15065 [Lentisphaerae bacterium RIFOXYC12_FULL_60_16]